jgi:hypothetical protein
LDSLACIGTFESDEIVFVLFNKIGQLIQECPSCCRVRGRPFAGIENLACHPYSLIDIFLSTLNDRYQSLARGGVFDIESSTFLTIDELAVDEEASGKRNDPVVDVKSLSRGCHYAIL